MLFPFALLAATVILARLTSSLFTSLLLQLNLTHSLCSVYFIPGPTSHYLLLIFSTTYQAGFANSEDLSQQGTYVSGHNDLVAVQLCGYHKCVCVWGGVLPAWLLLSALQVPFLTSHWCSKYFYLLYFETLKSNKFP